ncbi:hypothetical protein LEP1GSC074_2658 [Leptospira noguchii str. Hook]|uniref:Uncharacterized protein n=1 Tax=Leptospira noguchii serovar Autumnalis str. ZUN142 TaxID=1085540 RepID=M6U717_9LEPT|nr:hypothetical protein LEP1GSC186_0641 [Leptospira noguchii serovar Autumnalis str. ZUN142]EMS84208.1 hypothetical protein LEP1GSC074_2658 [Leptospira noguchii str. Hook]
MKFANDSPQFSYVELTLNNLYFEKQIKNVFVFKDRKDCHPKLYNEILH